MRILLWAVPFLPVAGGREVFTARLAGELVDRGHEVVVVAPAHGSGATVDADLVRALEIVRLPIGALIDVRHGLDLDLPTDLAAARTRLVALLDDFRPEVAHAHSFGPDLALLGGPARERSVPVLVTDHGLGAIPERALLAITQRMARIPTHVATVSNAARDALLAVFPELAGRLTVVPNGVPLPPTLTPVDPERGTVLAIGRLSAEKGIASALTAWSVLARSRSVPDLVVVGDGRDLPTLERLAVHLGVAERVRFVGWLPQRDVAQAYDEACLVLVPSLWAEPFGLVAAEAAAHGRAVIASRVGALPEIVDEGVTGWLTQPGDIIGLIGTLNAALSEPAQLVERGAAAAARAAEHYSLAACADGYEALYRRLIGS